MRRLQAHPAACPRLELHHAGQRWVVWRRMSLPGSGCEGLSVKLGTEGSLVPGWDFIPSQRLVDGEEGLLPSPPLALGSIGSCHYSLPIQSSSSAYLEENQAWNRLSLSVFQRLLATEGLTPSEVSMKAGSTNRQSGRSSGSGGKGILLLPDEEVVVPGGEAGKHLRDSSIPE